jgi:hypothetical protein
MQVLIIAANTKFGLMVSQLIRGVICQPTVFARKIAHFKNIII